MKPFDGKTALVTGGARRVGKMLVTALAQAGANVIIHYGSSAEEARQTAKGIEALGVHAWLLQSDLADLVMAEQLVEQAWRLQPFEILINNAAIFENLGWKETSLSDFQRHVDINLTAPFLISQSFALKLGGEKQGWIVNILDWRALRPANDHFPYTISKAGLAALTRSLAVALAPTITVNGLALGAVLPPSSGDQSDTVLERVPARRWATADEVGQALVFLLSGAGYTTGEILHLDGGRHLL
ncbi:MAG: SDR family NAD(P)-dependent oxidoreductase [Chloroflexota bacterium]|jgi:NAD(P)-dependent dehydrogenase (short-subunit alcohol dehydrogenase family)